MGKMKQECTSKGDTGRSRTRRCENTSSQQKEYSQEGGTKCSDRNLNTAWNTQLINKFVCLTCTLDQKQISWETEGFTTFSTDVKNVCVFLYETSKRTIKPLLCVCKRPTVFNMKDKSMGFSFFRVFCLFSYHTCWQRYQFCLYFLINK